MFVCRIVTPAFLRKTLKYRDAADPCEEEVDEDRRDDGDMLEALEGRD